MSLAESIAPFSLPPAAAPERTAPRWPLWVVFALACVGGIVALGRGLAILVPEMPSVTVVGTLVFALYTVFWAWLLGRADTFAPLSRQGKILAFVWGGVAATGICSLANTAIMPFVAEHLGAAWSAAFAGPFTEEAMKAAGIAVVLLLMNPRPRTTLDGLLVGAWVGLGFQVVEDVVLTMTDAYSMSVDRHDDLIVVVNSLINRGLLFGWFSHITFSGIIGFGVAYVLLHRGTTGRRWAVLIGLIVVAWFGHFLWNAPLLAFLGPISMLLQGVPFLLLLLYLVKLGRRDESAVYRPYLLWADPAFVTPEQIAELESPKTRKAARKASSDKGAERARQRARSSLAVAIATDDAPAADAACARLQAAR